NYLLMEKLSGDASYEVIVRRCTEELIDLLVANLKLLWKVDVSDCPSIQTLDVKLKRAKERVENNVVDVYDAEDGTFGEGGFDSPAELWEWLNINRILDDNIVVDTSDICCL